MPIFKNRYQYSKVYRPNGMKYSHGKAETIPEAFNQAIEAFVGEFNYSPRQEHCVIEVIGVTGAWDVTLNEIKD